MLNHHALSFFEMGVCFVSTLVSLACSANQTDLYQLIFPLLFG